MDNQDSQSKPQLLSPDGSVPRRGGGGGGGGGRFNNRNNRRAEQINANPNGALNEQYPPSLLLDDSSTKTLLNGFYANYLNYLPGDFGQKKPSQIDYPFTNLIPNYPPLAETPKQPSVLKNDVINAQTVLNYMNELCHPDNFGGKKEETVKKKLSFYEPVISIIYDPNVDLNSLPVDENARSRIWKTVEIAKAPEQLLNPQNNNQENNNGNNNQNNGEENDIPQEKYKYYSIHTRKNTTKPIYDFNDKVIMLIPTAETEEKFQNLNHPQNDTIFPKLAIKNLLHFYLNSNHTFFPLQSFPQGPDLNQPPKSIKFPFEPNNIPPLITIQWGRSSSPSQNFTSKPKTNQSVSDQGDQGVELLGKLEGMEQTLHGNNSVMFSTEEFVKQRVLYDLHFSCSFSHGTLQTVTPNLYELEKRWVNNLKNKNNLQKENCSGDDVIPLNDETSPELPSLHVSGFHQIPLQPRFLQRSVYNMDNFYELIYNRDRSTTMGIQNEGETTSSNTTLDEINIDDCSNNFIIRGHYYDNIRRHGLHLLPLNPIDFQNGDENDHTSEDNYIKNKKFQSIFAHDFFNFVPFDNSCHVTDITDKLTPLQKQRLSFPLTNGNNLSTLPFCPNADVSILHQSHKRARFHQNHVKDADNHALTPVIDDNNDSVSIEDDDQYDPLDIDRCIQGLMMEHHFAQAAGPNSVDIERKTVSHGDSNNTTTTNNNGSDSSNPKGNIQKNEKETQVPQVSPKFPHVKPQTHLFEQCYNRAFIRVEMGTDIESVLAPHELHKVILEEYQKLLELKKMDQNEPDVKNQMTQIVNKLYQFVQSKANISQIYQNNPKEITPKTNPNDRFYQLYYPTLQQTPSVLTSQNPFNPTQLFSLVFNKKIQYENEDEIGDEYESNMTPILTVKKTYKDFSFLAPNIDTTIRDTIFSHTIPCINTTYHPSCFNSKPIIGICICLRACSGSGKSTLANSIFSHRSQFDLKQSEPNSSLSSPNNIPTNGNLHQHTYMTGSDYWYSFPADHTLLTHSNILNDGLGNDNQTTTSMNNGEVNVSKSTNRELYTWDPSVLPLTHYICQTKAHNFMSHHWSKFLFKFVRNYSTFVSKHPALPSEDIINNLIKQSQPQQLDELPIIIMDNTNLSPQQLSMYHLSCILNGFIMVNLQPTTPWSATEYLHVKEKLAKRNKEWDVLILEEEKEMENLTQQGDQNDQENINQGNQVESLPIKLDEEQLKHQIELESIAHELYHRNTHGVPFQSVNMMLSSFTHIDDTYDMFIKRAE